MHIERDPHTQPPPESPRLVWMQWEQRWMVALMQDDVHTLAQLIGSGVDTPQKQEAATAAVQLMLNENRYAPKSVRLLLKNGWRVEEGMAGLLNQASKGRAGRHLDRVRRGLA